MNMKMGAFANRRYTRYAVRKDILISSAFTAAVTYFFLSVFQPFGTYNFYSPHKYFLLLPYSVFAFLAFAAADFLTRRETEYWSLKREVIKVTAALLACSIFNYWYCTTFVNRIDISVRALMYMSLYTFALGTPASIIHLQRRHISLRNHRETPTPLGESAPVAGTRAAYTIVRIEPQTGNALVLPKTRFLFAESLGNYCNVFFLDGDIPKKELLRISLKQLESQLCDEAIVRCHRSFIVNTERIIHAKGNAQGYQLQLEHTEMVVPVSRSHVGIIQKRAGME